MLRVLPILLIAIFFINSVEAKKIPKKERKDLVRLIDQKAISKKLQSEIIKSIFTQVNMRMEKLEKYLSIQVKKVSCLRH